jgi:hypothetical protein
MCQTFPHLAPLREHWRTRVAGLPTVQPPTGPTPFPYSLVGTAVDYRLRYALTLTPAEQLAAYAGAVLFDALRPGGIEIDDPERREVLQDLREARHQARLARAADRLRRIG